MRSTSVGSPFEMSGARVSSESWSSALFRSAQFLGHRYVERERCNVRSIRDAHVKADVILIISPIIIFLSFAQQVILIVASWLFSHGGKQPASRIMRKTSGATRVAEHSATRRQNEDILYPKSVEVLLRETARKNCSNPESDVDDPMIAPENYDVPQSGRVLELQNRDLWIRPTDHQAIRYFMKID